MSIRTFHIIFVIVATLLCVFLAGWGFLLAPSDMADSKIGYIGIAGALIMPIYGIYFYRKVKNITL